MKTEKFSSYSQDSANSAYPEPRNPVHVGVLTPILTLPPPLS